MHSRHPRVCLVRFWQQEKSKTGFSCAPDSGRVSASWVKTSLLFGPPHKIWPLLPKLIPVCSHAGPLCPYSSVSPCILCPSNLLPGAISELLFLFPLPRYNFQFTIQSFFNHTLSLHFALSQLLPPLNQSLSVPLKPGFILWNNNLFSPSIIPSASPDHTLA